MQFLTTLLLSTAAVLAAPTAQKPKFGNIKRMTDQAVLANVGDPTCWGGNITWPIAGRKPPIVETETPQLSLYPRPKTTPGTLTIHNYCGYDIWFRHFDGRRPEQQQIIEEGVFKSKGEAWTTPYAGTVVKARKSAQPTAQEMLVEYGVNARGEVTYNLSHVVCLGAGNDMSQCAGTESGLNFGNESNESKTFQCAGGKWCDDQSYLYEVGQSPHLRSWTPANTPFPGEHVQETQSKYYVPGINWSHDGVLRFEEVRSDHECARGV